MPVDFDELVKAGAIMGSGGMIVMDEDTCMVDVARYFLNFLAQESCGKCSPCREGVKQMHRILTNITEGKGKEGDIELLEELATSTRGGSLCALGRSAPNPVLSTIRYFRHEYETHIREKRCPSYSCKELVSYYIDPKKCDACRICMRDCTSQAIVGGKNLIHLIDQAKCNKCGTCLEVCPARFGAVVRFSGEPLPPPIPDELRVIVRKRREKREKQDERNLVTA
jgi:NADH-quinone oxidoreductase subunit F